MPRRQPDSSGSAPLSSSGLSRIVQTGQTEQSMSPGSRCVLIESPNSWGGEGIYRVLAAKLIHRPRNSELKQSK